MEFLKKLLHKFNVKTREEFRYFVKEIAKFSMAGFTNAIIFLLVYYVLVFARVDYLLANVFAFFVSVLNAYFWNTRFVFKKYNAACVKTLIKVYTSYSITFVISTIILYIVVDLLGFSKYIAPIFSLFVTVPLNFILNKLWIFKGQNINI